MSKPSGRIDFQVWGLSCSRAFEFRVTQGLGAGVYGSGLGVSGFLLGLSLQKGRSPLSLILPPGHPEPKALNPKPSFVSDSRGRRKKVLNKTNLSPRP